MMLHSESISTLRSLPFHTSNAGTRRCRALRSAKISNAQEVSTVEAATKKSSNGKSEIYVGKGRYIVDDPSKYPSRSEVTGGWAGGEVGLQSFVEEVKTNGIPKPPKAEEPASSDNGKGTVSAQFGDRKVKAKVVGQGQDTLYVGKGKYIKDDARKYPDKESLGPLTNVAGGFAGGEVGLDSYITKGDVPIAEGGVRSRQSSPLIAAMVVALGGTVGGLTLTQLTDFSANVLKSDISLAPIDDNTKLLLTVAIVLLGVTAAVAGTRVAIKQMSDSITNNVFNLAKITAFWIVVLVAVRFVLDS